MFSIRQNGNQWEVLDHEGGRVGDLHDTYDDALAAIAAQLAPAPSAPGSSDGLLPERWTSVEGIAFAERIDFRDFTAVSWTWRDPNVSTLPLMLQTETEAGHFGAELAGFVETIDSAAGTVVASGRFYDIPAGVMFRDLLLGDRRFGVSVDPGDVSADINCLEEDEFGFCVDEEVVFHDYQIIGLTGTPFPGFAQAAIQLEGANVGVVASALSLSVVPHLTARPPARWFDRTPLAARVAAVSVLEGPPPAKWFRDPEFDEATPLTIDDDGHIYGHGALWGTCHLGLPGCEEPFHDPDYKLFHLGYVETDEGRVPCGTLTMNTGHASTRRGVGMAEALAHYDNTGTQAARICVGEDEFGIWFNGVLDAELSANDIRRLEAAPLSADWRPVAGEYRLVRFAAVNTPGYAVPRVAAGMDGGALVAAIFSVGREDFGCGCSGGSGELRAALRRLDGVEATLAALGLPSQAAEAIAASL